MDRNKNLLSTKETAEMLGVSPSTVRRWSDDGTLPCYRIGTSGYRKFDKDVVASLIEQFYGTVQNVSETNETYKIKTLISENIPAMKDEGYHKKHKR